MLLGTRGRNCPEHCGDRFARLDRPIGAVASWTTGHAPGRRRPEPRRRAGDAGRRQRASDL